MTVYSKYNIVYLLQKWMDSVPGQTFLNYAYSWGASVVILGTLFKLTHLPGANAMLFIGMGTEVVVFFLSAFDRPFDKTAIGMDLATHMDDTNPQDEVGETVSGEGQTDEEKNGQAPGGGIIVIGGGVAGSAEAGGTIGGEAAEGVAGEGAAIPATGAQPATIVASAPAPTWMEKQQELAPEMEEATGNYIEELKNLTELLGKVAEQSQRLTRDSEEMENLNRTLTGICKIYELQLKAASQQVGTIDEINEQTKKMADRIAELNAIYARMIEAMTVNMPKV